MKATERLYLNSDQTKVVKEGDKDAAFLLAHKGQDIPKNIVEKYKLNSKADKKELKSEVETKEVKKADTKKKASK